MLRSKRGISPILATLLLIVIAVAAIVITYAWVIAFTGSTTGMANEWVEFTNVRFYNSNKVEVTLMVPTGKSPAKIMEIYVGPGSYDNVTKQTSISPALPQTISEGQSMMLTLTYSYTSNTRYYFKVVTEIARTYEYDQKATA